MIKPFVSAILLCSGEGSRFKNTTPKQFLHLSGKKIYLYALEALYENSLIDSITLVCHRDYLEQVSKDLTCFEKKEIILVVGGKTRQESSYKGIKSVNEKTTHVLIHDAVRPFLDPSIIQENVLHAQGFGACDTCISSFDTIIQSKDQDLVDQIPNRKEFLRGQTPQSFSLKIIKEAHEKAIEHHILDATDDCQLVLRENHRIKIARGSEENIKITTELDLIIAEQILRLRAKTLYEEQRSLTAKVFAITGASGDIGRAISDLLKIEGAIVLEISRNSGYKADLKDPQQASSIFQKIYQNNGEIDGLINCVGSLTRGNIKDLSSMQIIEMIENNFTAVALASKYCKVKKGGHIVNFSSSSYTRGRASYGIYSAMKAAIVNFTQAFSLEEPSLQINTLVPTRANTQMRKSNFPNEDYTSLLSCEKIAAEVVKILKTKNITGMTIEITKD